MKQAVFIERDGVLNQVRVERQHQVSPLTLEEFHPEQKAVSEIKRLKAGGLVVIATTNQPGLSRGYQSRRELDGMHALLRRTFDRDDLSAGLHDETERSPSRKPKPVLLVEAAFTWHLDLDRSFVISEKWQDAEAARAAGCTSLLVQSPWVRTGHRNFVRPDLASVVDKILSLKGATRVMAA